MSDYEAMIVEDKKCSNCTRMTELQEKYDKLNDFSESQCAKLLKENAELKVAISKMETTTEKNSEVEELKAQIEPLLERITNLRRNYTSLQKENESLRCCGNYNKKWCGCFSKRELKDCLENNYSKWEKAE